MLKSHTEQFLAAAVSASISSMRTLDAAISTQSADQIGQVDVQKCYEEAKQLVRKLEPFATQAPQ